MSNLSRIGSIVASIAISLRTSSALAEEVNDRKTSVQDRPPYVRLWMSASIGSGVRFNNPYRLPTPLGSDAESVSLLPFYFSHSVTALFGDPMGWNFGASLAHDFSVQGVTQHVLTPSFVAARRSALFGLTLRAGTPVVLNPEASMGMEASIGGAWFFRAAMALKADLIASLFFGAATPDVRTTSYPLLAAQLGLLVEWERLP